MNSMARLWLLRVISLPVVFFVFLSCGIASKGPTNDLGSAGGTSTGNALGRRLHVDTYRPHYWSTGTQRARFSISGVRALVDGVWHERDLMRSEVIIQPTGTTVGDLDELALPRGRYQEVILTLDRFVTVNENGTYTLLPSANLGIPEMRFVGSQTDTGNGIRLIYQTYADNIISVSSNAQLAAQFGLTTGQIGAANNSQHNHILFIVPGVPAGPGGLSAFDAACESSATAGVNAGILPPGATWRALASTDAIDANSRVTLLGPVYNADGQGSQILAEPQDFWNPTTDWRASQSFSSAGLALGTVIMWTGSDSLGVHMAFGSCDDWESTNAPSGARGASGQQNSARMFATTLTCAGVGGVYCLSE